jgi:hypothetical protein
MVPGLVAALLVAALILTMFNPAQSAATAAPAVPSMPTCDRPAVIEATMQQLGEHETAFAVITPEQAKAIDPDAGAYATATATVYSTALPCRYLPAVVAHEVAHVWEARKYGSMARAERAYGVELEPIADCAAVATGWEFYRPYLTARGYGCTDYERQAAAELRRWAR